MQGRDWATVAASLTVALFTSVLAQYWFAPWLEARKSILGDRLKNYAQGAHMLRTMAGNRMTLTDDAFKSLLTADYLNKVVFAIPAKEAKQLAGVVQGVKRHTQSGKSTADQKRMDADACFELASLVDPLTPPWMRWRHRRKLSKNSNYVLI